MNFWSRIGARNTLRTPMFRERERLGAHHAATCVLNFFEAIENDIQQNEYENIKTSFEICIQFGTT